MAHLKLGNTASEPLSSQWIAANAGSGKTTALVGRVLTLLLMGVTPERVCCITYTKAAAGEMRERILKALRKLLVLPDDECREFMIKSTGTLHDITRARRLFTEVLDSPQGGLQLTTIHGFCQQLLRRFPLEAGLSPQFTVLEETDSEELQREARRRLLSDAEGELAEALSLIADRGGEHAFNDLLRNAVSKADHWHDITERYPLPELLKEAMGVGITEESVRRACAETLVPDALRPALTQFTGSDAVCGNILARWLEGQDRLRLLDELFPVFYTQAGEPRKKPFSKSVPMADQMQRIFTSYVEMVDRCRAIACAEESYAAALVAQSFLREYEALKRARQALDYDDLIRRTEQLLKEYGGWVMSKLDHRIDHLLVDEAQDTSPGQWRIVHTLVEELMVTGGGIGSGGVPRSLLVVGDEKQSIFSFQGADPKQFFSERAIFDGLLSASGSTLEQQALEASYRSAHAILSLVDEVAASPGMARALSAEGVPAKHLLIRKNAVGRVVLHPPGEKKVKEESEAFTIPTEYLIRETPPQILATRIAREIKGWVEAGRAVPGDILILLWRRHPFAGCLIRALEKEGVPVAGIDRLKLSEHLAVRDLMALMRWCGYPGDDLALAQVLRSPIIGMSGEELEELAFGRKSSLWEALPAGLKTQLDSILQQKNRTPYAFLTHILETLDARTRFVARFGEEVHEVLDELKAQAASLPKTLPATIAAFSDWITRSEREVKRQQEGQGDAVRIMTVHGAKGLEAPIVLLVNPIKKPDTARETSLTDANGNPLIAFSDDGKKASAYTQAKDQRRRSLFDEFYRLLYVALTRARNELHIFAAEPPPAKEEGGEEGWYTLVAQAMRQLPSREEGDLLVLQDTGTPALATPKPRHESPALPAWARSIPKTASATPRVLSPSRLAVSESYGMAAEPGANIRGVRIHRVLQFLTAESDRSHIAQLLALAGGSDEREIDEIAKLHAEHRWLWEHPSHPEVTLGGTVEGQQFGGQVDRLVMTPEAVVIVDYKTGAHIPKTPAEVPQTYRLQLKIYRELLRQIYPGKPIKAALLWTSTPSIMWLDAELDATSLPVCNLQTA